MYFKVSKTANRIEKNKNPYRQAKHLRIYRLVGVVVANAVIMHGLRPNVAQPINIK